MVRMMMMMRRRRMDFPALTDFNTTATVLEVDLAIVKI